MKDHLKNCLNCTHLRDVFEYDDNDGSWLCVKYSGGRHMDSVDICTDPGRCPGWEAKEHEGIPEYKPTAEKMQ